MARVTTEDCIEKIPNRFLLVHLASRRARQLVEGAHPTVQSSNKELVTALREVAAGHIVFEEPIEELIHMSIAPERDDAPQPTG